MWTLELSDEGGASESFEFDTEPTADQIEEQAEKWARGGDWGSEGASVRVGWTLYDQDDEEVSEGRVRVEIEPDHSALIKAACRRSEVEPCGWEPDAHDWTSEGEGGLDENPGVWSTGGTSMLFLSHCRKCGLRRREHSCGSQRNPGEHDTVQYTMPDRWCAECEREECDCGQDEE